MHPKKLKSVVPGRMNSVQVVDQDLSTALKVWKRMLKENNTIEDCYDRKFYKKPSQIRRLELNTARFLQSKQG